MKVEKIKKAFEPVVITLETERECKILKDFIVPVLCADAKRGFYPSEPIYALFIKILEKLND